MSNPIYDGNLWAGSVWYTGTADPIPGNGVNGDFYLKTTTDEVWKKENGAWGVLVDLTGNVGPQGLTGYGVSDGGTTRQLFSKTSNTDYDADWRSIDSTDINTAMGFNVIPNIDTLQLVTDRGTSTSNSISITNSTPSTDKTSGALTISGGLGVGGAINASIITATTFIGNLTGTATAAQNGVVTTTSYADPFWINTLSYSKLVNVPTASTSISGVAKIDGTSITITDGVLSVNPSTYSTTTQMNTAISTAVSDLVNSAPSALNTLKELSDALGADASFSTTVTNALAAKAPIASPTFTGTVSGITATMVGLGNVTNTSDASKPVSTAQQTALDLKANVASPTFTGIVTFPQITEVVSSKTGASGVVAHDLATSAIFYHTSVSSNFTANFTNVPTTDNRTIVVTLMIQQGATAYIPNAVQIAGSNNTIKWIGGNVPTGNINKLDFFAFTLIRISGAWTAVTGSLNTYG